MTEIVKAQWYPLNPPMLPGEGSEAYTNRLTGASGPLVRPYDHSRNRQCSINYHDECSDRSHRGALNPADGCGCPCHPWRLWAADRVEEWNAAVWVGTVVEFVEGCDEPPAATTSKAFVLDGWPMVELDTFADPVELPWLVRPA